MKSAAPRSEAKPARRNGGAGGAHAADRARTGPGTPLFLQHKCACGGSGACTCGSGAQPGRDEEQAPLQKKEASSGGGPSVHATARRGVDSASRPLPHLDRIQRSFGDHDLSGIKTQVGGPASDANDAMGSVGYTMGNRVGFRSAPDVKLAAHEATHVLHQRSGVQLSDGVGHPGDRYERHADAVADAVERGESAEPLLARGAGHGIAIARGSGSSDAVVQHQLAVDATRVFEPPMAPDDSAAGAGAPAPPSPPPAPPPAAAPPAPPQQEAQPPEGDAAPGAASGGPGGPVPGAPPAGGTGAPGGKPAPCSGGGVPHCYDADSEQPANEPDETPQNPPGNKTKEETSDAGEEDAPEPDVCPPPQVPPGAAAPASGGGAPAPASTTTGSGAGGAPTAAGGAATAAGATPASAPGSGGGPGASTKASRPPAPGGGGGSQQGSGGEGGASEPAGPAPAASPFDDTVAQLESQRNDAVAGYGAANVALNGASDEVRALRNGVTFVTAPNASTADAARRDAATSRANTFFSEAADRVDQVIQSVSQPIPDRIGTEAESGKAAIAASIETEKAAISARIAAARRQARGDAAIARRAVTLQASRFVGDVHDQTDAAIRSLTETHAKTTEQVNALETTTLENINLTYANGRTDLEDLGHTVGNEATTTGQRFADTYNGFKSRNPPCHKDSFWDGDLNERRIEAQRKAALSTAKGYHDRLVDAARKRAREVTKAGRKKDRCSVIRAAIGARASLDQQLQNLISALNTARDTTVQQSESTRASILSSIGRSLAATLHQLDQQEHDQRQSADDAGYSQQLLQEQIAFAGAASLQRTTADAARTVQSALADLQARVSGSEPPDLEGFDGALATVTQRVRAALDGLGNAVDGGAELTLQLLSSAAQQGAVAVQAVTESNDALATSVSDGFTASMSGIAGTDNFADERAGFSRLTDSSVAGGGAALAQVLGGMREGCRLTVSEAEATLKQAHTALDQNLHDSKKGIECDITTKADQAASEEAPAWKKVLAVVLIIIVIVIVIAVIVVTAGGALAALGPLATIAAGALIGAAVGAVTSGLIAIATNLWSNRRWSQGVLKAVAIGAVTGFIGGGIGAAAGVGAGIVFQGATKAVQVAAQFGAAMLTAGGMDVVTQYVTGGFSFDHFSWGQLGLTLVITAITFGIGHKIGAARAVAAARGAGGPPPPGETGAGIVPGDQAPPTVKPPEEPVTVPPADQTATPAKPPEQPPAPAPTDQTAAPAKPPEQPTAPAPPDQTAAPAKPAEQSAAAAPPDQTAAPAKPPEQAGPAPPEETTAPKAPEAPVPAENPKATAAREQLDEHLNRLAEEGTDPKDLGFNEREWEQFQRDYETDPEAALKTLQKKLDILGNPAESTTPSREASAEENARLADEVRDEANPRTSRQTTGPERARAAADAPERPVAPDEPPTVPDEVPEGGLFDDPDAVSATGLRRPGLTADLQADVEAAAPKNALGEFVDDSGNVIQEPDFGHKPGFENRRILAAADELGLTQEQLNEYVNSRPEFFQIEEHAVNISHANEEPGIEPFDHIVTDMRQFFGR
jgi:hypothetical protein